MRYELLYLLVLMLPLAAYVMRRGRRHRAHVSVLKENEEAGLNEPASMHPVINPALCIGSGSCVKACPEAALGMVGGKATLINASACIGHGACAMACPFEAITLVFGTDRRGMEVPTLSPTFESNVKGLYIAGELGGMGLIRKAVQQGRQAMDAIHAQLHKANIRAEPGALDVLVVGSGPAGLSAALAAKAHGMSFRLIEQEATLGGTVYHYPRAKIAMTSPVDLAIVGTMKFNEVSKEKLLDFWSDVVRRVSLKVHFDERMTDLRPIEGGGFEIITSRGTHRARHVLLAMGRRGSPRKLDVPGEESDKVVYRLADAEQYRGQHVLVVGGGDSAIEAAVALAEVEGTHVALSYRSKAFSRVKAANRRRIDALAEQGRVKVVLESVVKRIEPRTVHLIASDQPMALRNDTVIVCAGGLPPIGMLQSMGIHFETKHGTA